MFVTTDARTGSSECEDDITFLIQGHVWHKTPGFFTKPMVHLGEFSLLNPAAATFACPSMNHLPIRGAFLTYLAMLCVLACMYAVLVLLEGFGCIGGSSIVGTDVELDSVALAIERTSSPEQIMQINGAELGVPGLKVTPEPWFKLMPPGGVVVTCALAAVDCLVLDILTVFKLLLTYHYWFATIMTAIVAYSLCMEADNLKPSVISWELRESRRRGFVVGSVATLLDHEQGFEAAMSFAFTTYTLPFSVRTYFDLGTSIVSLLLSVFGIARYVVNQTDSSTSSSSSSSCSSTSSSSSSS